MQGDTYTIGATEERINRPSSTLAKTAEEYSQAAQDLKRAQDRWDAAKKAFSEAEEALREITEEIASDGATEVGEEG